MSGSLLALCLGCVLGLSTIPGLRSWTQPVPDGPSQISSYLLSEPSLCSRLSYVSVIPPYRSSTSFTIHSFGRSTPSPGFSYRYFGFQPIEQGR